MDEQVFVAGSKHEAAAKLQRIFSQAMLLVSCGLCPLARLHIVFAQKVEQCSVAQAHSFIGFALIIDQKRELDAGFLAEELGIVGIAQSNRGKTCASLLELGFKFAQLRDVLAAKDSTVVTKEDKNGWALGPQRAEADAVTVRVGKCDPGKPAAERFGHAGHFPVSRVVCQVLDLLGRWM